MKLRLFTVAALLALLAPLAHAETLDEVLAKHWEAQGGLAKIQAVKSYRMTGKMAIGPGMEAPFVMEKKRPNYMRMEFTVQGMTGVQAYDGKQGWMIMPFMGKPAPEAMPAEAQTQVEEQADFDGPLMNWKDKGNTVELLGKEDLDGTPAFKVKVTHKNGNVDYTFIDGETFLILKQEGKRNVRGTDMEAESIVGDYKMVDGLMLPHSMESGAKGAERRQRMTFEKIEVNPAIEESRFQMPVVAKADSAAAPAAKAGDKGPAKPGAKKADKP